MLNDGYGSIFDTLPETAKLTFRYTAGALIRNKIKREFEKICFDHDLELNIREVKGIFDSDYFVKITGNTKIIMALKPHLEKWFKKIQKG